MAQKNVTLVHGDIKSPNIFYDKDKEYEPVFIDWQHVALGSATVFSVQRILLSKVNGTQSIICILGF